MLAIQRVAEARRIVADQQKQIAGLKAAGQPTLDAEQALQVYCSALKHLEDRARRMRDEGEAKQGESKKPKLRDRRLRRKQV